MLVCAFLSFRPHHQFALDSGSVRGRQHAVEHHQLRHCAGHRALDHAPQGKVVAVVGAQGQAIEQTGAHVGAHVGAPTATGRLQAPRRGGRVTLADPVHEERRRVAVEDFWSSPGGHGKSSFEKKQTIRKH